jgi:hypothetical protein
MEYDRAVEHGVHGLSSLWMKTELKASDVEKGIGGEKLDALRARISTERVVNFLKIRTSSVPRSSILSHLTQKNRGQKKQA